MTRHERRFTFPYRSCRGIAVHLRHLAIHEDHGIGKPRDRLHRLPTVRRDINAVALSLQHLGRHLLVHHIILHHQHASPFSGARLHHGVAGDQRRGGGIGGPWAQRRDRHDQAETVVEVRLTDWLRQEGGKAGRVGNLGGAAIADGGEQDEPSRG